MGNLKDSKSLCRLYLITPPKISIPVFSESLKQALDGGDVACLQLRLKDTDDDAVRRATEALMPITREYNVAFVLNDRPDLAAELKVDGCHIGQKDAHYEVARDAIGADQIVGVTCHNSRHLAIIAGENGADYVAFGAFYPTTTKQVNDLAKTDLLTWWSQTCVIPCVAIGGITVDNCGPLVSAGADFIAVISSVWNHPKGPLLAVSSFNSKIAHVQSNDAD